jgi:thiol-disulfide isomerase/thioredoxin
MDKSLLIVAALALLVGCGSETPTVPASQARPVAFFPRTLDSSCGEGRARLYDECGSQLAIFQAALEEARTTRKTVIVNYGAEWCIWCHVFDMHVRGATGRFRYPVEGQEVTLTERSGREVLPDAALLNEFAAENFVLAHIEADHAPDGWSVLEATGAAAHFNDNYPFVFSVTPDGRFAAVFEHENVEVRRDQTRDWYRGYDRRALIAELERMRAAALSAPSPTQ